MAPNFILNSNIMENFNCPCCKSPISYDNDFLYNYRHACLLINAKYYFYFDHGINNIYMIIKFGKFYDFVFFIRNNKITIEDDEKTLFEYNYSDNLNEFTQENIDKVINFSLKLKENYIFI